MENMTSASILTKMHGYLNATDDDLSTETTETETQIPLENFTGNSSNNSEYEYSYYGGEWIGIYHPMVWKIPHFENLFVYGLGVCLVFGTIGNILSFIVLLRKNMRKMPTTPYLCSLAVVDLLILWAITQEEWFLKVTGRPVISNIPCNLSFYFIYAFDFWSSWLLVSLTAERLLVIKFPFKSLTRSHSTRARYITVILLPLFSFALNSIFLFLFEDTPYGCDYVQSLIIYSEGIEIAFLVLSTIAPLCILLVCNGLIIYELSMAAVGIDKEQRTVRKKEIRNLTTLTLVVSLTYIILKSPVTIFYTVLTMMGEPFVSPDNGDAFALSTEDMFLVQMIVELLNLCNHSINFLLYVVASPRFRDEILNIIPKQLKQKKSSGSRFSATNSNSDNTVKTVTKDLSVSSVKEPNSETAQDSKF